MNLRAFKLITFSLLIVISIATIIGWFTGHSLLWISSKLAKLNMRIENIDYFFAYIIHIMLFVWVFICSFLLSIFAAFPSFILVEQGLRSGIKIIFILIIGVTGFLFQIWAFFTIYEAYVWWPKLAEVFVPDSVRQVFEAIGMPQKRGLRTGTYSYSGWVPKLGYVFPAGIVWLSIIIGLFQPKK